MCLLLFLLLFGDCLGQDPYYYQDHNFSYSVEDDSSGNQFGHSENSHGGATNGVYHVLLPDGRLQTVEYTVDRYAGFQATVQYLGSVLSSPRSVHRPVEDLVYAPPLTHTPTATAQSIYTYSDPQQPSFIAFNPSSAPSSYHPASPAPSYHTSSPNPIYHMSSTEPSYHTSSPATIYHVLSSTLGYHTPSTATSYHAPSPSPGYHTPSPAFSYLDPIPSTRYHTPSPSYHTPSPATSYHDPSPSPTYQTLSPAPYHHYYQPQATAPQPVLYIPLSYKPAPVTQYDPHVHNLLVTGPIHNLHHTTHHQPPPRVTPLAPPEHQKMELEEPGPDPYLMTEEEVKRTGRTFSDPFWYPQHRKILRKSRKEDPEKEVNNNHLK